MMLKKATTFAIIAMIALTVRAKAQVPCAEYLRLRNAATDAWKAAIRVSPSERCWALRQASLAAEATLHYADNNRDSCGISATLLDRVETQRREIEKARQNVCAGRLLRPFPPDIIQQ